MALHFQQSIPPAVSRRVPTRAFTEHPASVGETYGEHFKVALSFSRQLAGASLAAALHAFCPAMCTKTASKKIDALHEQMHAGARGNPQT